MATISNGSVTVTIQPGEQYRVIATGEAYVDIGGGSTQSYRLVNGASERLLGGFIVATPVTVRVISGSVEYINVTGTGEVGSLSLAQASRPDITGVVASDNDGDPIDSSGRLAIKQGLIDVLKSAVASANARNPQLLTADSSIATVSSSSAAPSLTNKLNLPLQQNSLANYLALVSTEGGWPVNAYSASLQVLAGHNNPGAAGANWIDSVAGAFASSWRASFLTNDQNPVLVYNKGGNSYRPRVLIDDQYVSLTGHAPQGAGAGLEYLTLALPSVKTRKITLELQLDQFFNRIIVANDSICVPAPSKPLTMFVLGDSYTYGPGIGAGVASDQTTVFLGQGLYRVAADWLGIDCINSGIGGTGYTAGSYKYDDRWGDVLNTNWDILVIHGSINDGYASSTPVADVLAAASALINKAVAAYPDKPIIVTGVYPAAGSTLTRMKQIDAGLASLVSTLNSSRVKFISCINNIPTWTAGNALIAADNAHLQPVTGHAAMGRKLAAEIYKAVLSMY